MELWDAYVICALFVSTTNKLKTKKECVGVDCGYLLFVICKCVDCGYLLFVICKCVHFPPDTIYDTKSSMQCAMESSR
jgi:hypothetical protein